MAFLAAKAAAADSIAESDGSNCRSSSLAVHTLSTGYAQRQIALKKVQSFGSTQLARISTTSSGHTPSSALEQEFFV